MLEKYLTSDIIRYEMKSLWITTPQLYDVDFIKTNNYTAVNIYFMETLLKVIIFVEPEITILKNYTVDYKVSEHYTFWRIEIEKYHLDRILDKDKEEKETNLELFAEYFSSIYNSI